MQKLNNSNGFIGGHTADIFAKGFLVKSIAVF
jgi:hypothetical protein